MKHRFDLSVLNAIPATEVAEWLGETRRKGCRQVTLCPWHDDTVPSLTIYDNGHENHFHCFACGKDSNVIGYVMQMLGVPFKDACEALCRQFGIGDVPNSQSIPVRRIVRQQQGPCIKYIPADVLNSLVSVENSLCDCLVHLFDRNRVEEVAMRYRLGRYNIFGNNRFTLFPNIDANGNVCNIKAQVYNSNVNSECFCHCDKKRIYWIGTMLEKDGLVTGEGEFSGKCLFGEHLIRDSPSSTIALVESPKNAIIGALYMPDYLWVAAGNASQISGEGILEPLRGRDVIVYPDRDAIGMWKEALRPMKKLANFCVSDFCETHAAVGQEKFDIADYIINKRLYDRNDCPF